MQAVFVRNGLMGQVRREAIALFLFRAAEKLIHLFLGQSDRKNAVLKAIVVKNIGKARRNNHAKPIIQDGPRRMLAARTTAEIVAGQQDGSSAVAGKIQHKFRIGLFSRQVAPIVEQGSPEAFASQRLQKLLGHHLVGIYVDAVQRCDHSGVHRERFHSSYSTWSTSHSRTSTKCPAMAAAAAITGLTRCVRLPLPWRPSKLRLEVLALRSPGGSMSGFMPMHMLQPASRHSKPAS